MVIALPGEAVTHKNFVNLVHDFALLQSLGIKLVILQGARPQIQALLDKHKIDAPITEGTRVSVPEAMPHIVNACNSVKTELESAMSAGLAESPMHQLNLHTLSGNFVSAQPMGIADGVDYQFTGKVRSVDTKSMRAAIETGAAVLINTLGYSTTGEVFNLYLSDVLEQVATSLNADKVVCFTDDAHLGPNFDHQILKPGSAKLAPKDMHSHSDLIQSAARAVHSGVSRGHIVSYETNGALLEELFTHDGSGLLICEDEFVTIRDADSADVSGILELIQPLQDSGVLVVRTRELLEQEISNFCVVEIDGTIAGCGALVFLENQMAEVACLAVHPEFQGRGFASKVVSALESKARSQDQVGLVVLTTQATHWFAERGYVEATQDQLPPQRKSLYSVDRNSKVLIKSIN